MILLALDWIDWPAVAVLVGVSATWAEAWLRNRREERDHNSWHERFDTLGREIDGKFDALAREMDTHQREIRENRKAVSELHGVTDG